MNIRLMFITRDPEVAKIAQRAGIDWIFVDLEYRGKDIRQANRDTVISAHTIADVVAIRTVVKQSKLLVRINPLGPWSKDEINDVISAGADIIMLPFFKTEIEVRDFITLVAKRATTCLLVETMEAVENIDSILNIDGIDYLHIGLNDLHIERGTTFMFEFLSDGSMDNLAEHIKRKNIPFGFGGMARIGELIPPAECILAEHYRLGSSGVILSRNFCNPSKFENYKEVEESIIEGVRSIRKLEEELIKKPKEFFEVNRKRVNEDIMHVVSLMKK